MSKLLYIKANPQLEEKSFSLSVGREFIDTYRKESDLNEIIELNLYNEYIPEIDLDVLTGWSQLGTGTDFNNLPLDQKKKLARINELTEQFISADKYVFAIPMWNFGIPPRLKAYIDTIVIAGKTFIYTTEGPQGLLSGKKAVLIHARGGVYSDGPMKEKEFSERYLDAILRFIGIDCESIVIEGQAYQPELADNIKVLAIEKAREIAKQLVNY